MQEKIIKIMDELEELRQELCEIENQRGQRSILAIDRIDALLLELKEYID